MQQTFIERDGGGLALSELTTFVKSGILVPPSANQPVITPARSGSANGVSPSIIVEAPTNAYAKINSLIGAHGAADASAVQARLQVLISDISGIERTLMNRPALVNHVFGSNENPFFMDDYSNYIMLEPLQDLQFQFFNASTGGTSNFSFMLEATKYQREALRNSKTAEDVMRMLKKFRQVCPYWFSMNQNISSTNNPGVTLAASASSEISYTAREDTFLILTALMGTGLTAGVTGDTNEIFTVQIFDARTGQPLQNQEISFNCAAGNAQFPYILPTPLFVEPSQTLQCIVRNLITDASTDVFLTFHGIAMYGTRGLYSK